MRICPVCEGLTTSEQRRCGTCDVQLVRTTELGWVERSGDELGHSPWIGVVIGGKYRVTGVLGKGGMGTVYRAEHELSLLPVAVKVLHPSFARHAGFKATLIAEARKASLLRSEHTARVLDVGETPEGSIFIAMELALGETLDRILDREKQLEPWVVCELLLQVLDGLEEAAGRGLVHRDLSPRNIMIEARDGGFRAKILDFGIATRSDDLGREHASAKSSAVAGRWVHPPYTAPEILREEAHDARADLFSLGVVALQCLTGTPPFSVSRSADLDARMRAVLEDEVVLPSRKQAPQRLSQLIARLLAKDPDERPASPRAVRDAVEAMRRPTSASRQAAAVLSIMLGSLALLTSLTAKSDVEPFLQASSASPLVLEARRAPGVEAQHLAMERVERLAFVARGLEPGDILVRGYDGTTNIFEYQLGGRLDRGRLELDASRDPSWRAILDSCSRREGAVALDFQDRRSQRLVAHALVFVDTVAPVIEVADAPERLSLATRLRLRIEEDSPRVALRLELRRGDRVLASHEREVASREREVEIPIGRVLALADARGPELDDFGPATLVVVAADSAGRVTKSAYELERVDLWIPSLSSIDGIGSSILDDPSLPASVVVDSGVAKISVRLAHEERAASRLHLRVRFESTGEGAGDASEAAVERVLERGDFAMQGTRLSFMQSDLRAEVRALDIRVELEDASGNRSAALSRTLLLDRVELGAAFAIVHEGREVDALDRRARLSAAPWSLRVAENVPLVLEYRCNQQWIPAWVPDAASGIVIEKSDVGRTRVTLPGFAAGRTFSLRVHHVRADGVSVEPLRSTTTLDVVVLPGVPAVAVPGALAQGSFSTELVAAKLLTIVDDSARLALTLAPFPEASLDLRARYWHERNGRWFAGDWVRVEDAELFARMAAPLLPGPNRIALEVEDALGRATVSATSRVDTRPVVEVAKFWHAAEPLGLATAAVEFGRSAQVLVLDEAPLPLGSATTLLHGQRSYPGTIALTSGQAREHRFDLPFDFVSAVCGWTSIAREDFATRQPATQDFVLRTRAGDRRCGVRFEPTRSLLRGLRLGALGVRQPALAELMLVPCLAPREDVAVLIGPPPEATLRGSLAFDPPIAVRGLRDVYVAANEVTRRMYYEFVRDVLARTEEPDFVPTALLHLEDPLGADRLTLQNLLPDLSIFEDRSFEDVVAKAPERPVTGVNYYQASAFCRWLGFVTFGNVDFFRLPFGAELEWAALGEGLGRDAVHGIRVASEVRAETWRHDFVAFRETARAGQRMDAGRWPRDATENRRAGDVARAWDGSEMVGLEFGVREWVEDLPALTLEPSYRLLIEVHDRHVDYTAKRRDVHDLKPPRTLELAIGQVRGISWGEPVLRGIDSSDHLNDVRGAGSAEGILGVKRVASVRRDGLGIDGRVAPKVDVTGFRVVGAEAFVKFMRSKS